MKHKKIVQKRRKKAVEQELFTEEEMRGGISDDVGDVFVDAYLEAIRIISRLNDEKFFALSKQYQWPKEPEKMYFLPALPTHIMTFIQYWMLGQCIELRHAQEYYHDCSQQQPIVIVNCYEEARMRFEKENENGEYKYINWLIRIENI